MARNATSFKLGFDPRRNLEGKKSGTQHFSTLVRNALSRVAKLKQGNPEQLTHAQVLADSVLARAIQGDNKMTELLWAYMDGKPIQGLMLADSESENSRHHQQISNIIMQIYGKKKKAPAA